MLNPILADEVRCCQCRKSFSEVEANKWGNGWVSEDDRGELYQEGTCLKCQADNQRIGKMFCLSELEQGDKVKHKGETFIIDGRGFGKDTIHLWGQNGANSGDAPKSLIVQYRGKSDY